VPRHKGEIGSGVFFFFALRHDFLAFFDERRPEPSATRRPGVHGGEEEREEAQGHAPQKA
jgi:hypothetical protein